MKNKWLTAGAAVVLAIAGMLYGASASVRALNAHQTPSGLAVQLAWWAGRVPGLGWVVPQAPTQIAVHWHQLRESAEFSALPELQAQGAHTVERLQPLAATQPQAATLGLTAAVRMPQLPPQTAELAQAVQTQFDQATPALLQLQMAEALAMYYARTQQWDNAQQWLQRGLQALPESAEQKAQTLANTARNVMPLRVALAACIAGSDRLVPTGTQALAKGFDIAQLRQEYVFAWDKPLLLQMPSAVPPCQALGADYQRLLITSD